LLAHLLTEVCWGENPGKRGNEEAAEGEGETARARGAGTQGNREKDRAAPYSAMVLTDKQRQDLYVDGGTEELPY
jgi:hypothetical protein